MGDLQAAGDVSYGVAFFVDDDGTYTKINVQLDKRVIDIDMARVYVANLAGAEILGTSDACFNCKALPIDGTVFLSFLH